MAQYAIILGGSPDDAPSREVARRIKEQYPRHYRPQKGVFLVQSDIVADRIAAAVGLRDEGRVEGANGVVLKLNGTYAGYASNSLWDWLESEA